MKQIGQAYGTEAQIAAYTGNTQAPGQIVWSTDGKRLYVFDGSTQGGFKVAMAADLSDYALKTDYLSLTDASATYMKLAGGTFTGAVSGIAPTADANFATKGYVDGAVGGIQGVPPGFILPFAGTSIPEGWLICNGAAVSRTEYAALFSAIGTKWGEGDGSTTFNLPDLDERFIEGTVDTSKVGEYVEAGLPDIVGSGPVGWLTDAAYGMSGAFFCKQDAGESIAPSAANREYREGFDASRCSSVYGSAETVLPSSVRILACIKI